MSKVIKNNQSGAYFVSGKGFVGTEKTATRYATTASASDTVTCLAETGIVDVDIVSEGSASSVAAKAVDRSFAVCYIRPTDINAQGEVLNKKLQSGWPSTPSPRRFATFDEARVHGSRFHERRVNRTDAPGTCNHKGFYVIKTKDPVNAYVNPETGLTN